jgi:hypothetical protein
LYYLNKGGGMKYLYPEELKMKIFNIFPKGSAIINALYNGEDISFFLTKKGIKKTEIEISSYQLKNLRRTLKILRSF